MRRQGCVWMIACLLLVGATVAAAAYRTGGVIEIREPVREDLYLAGRRIEVTAPVEGDLVAAGRSLELNAEISEDVLAAGEIINVRAAVGDDIRAAGRSIRIDAPVGGHVVAAGETVVLGPRGDVSDWAWLAGNEIRIGGRVGRGVRAVGASVLIGGQIDGDVEIRAERVELSSGARIDGNLRVYSDNAPLIAADAVVTGSVRHAPPARDPRPRPPGLWASAFALLAMMVAAVVVYLLFPGYAARAAALGRSRPLALLGVGLAVLLGVPLLALVCFVTGVGVLLGLALVCLYLVALLAALLSACFLLAGQVVHLAGDTARPRALGALAVAMAVVVLALARWVPLLGSLVMLLLVLLGLGVLGLQLWGQYRRPVAAG
jgi:cytoskeletal protein CcmA (bactofilin family)